MTLSQILWSPFQKDSHAKSKLSLSKLIGMRFINPYGVLKLNDNNENNKAKMIKSINLDEIFLLEYKLVNSIMEK